MIQYMNIVDAWLDAHSRLQSVAIDITINSERVKRVVLGVRHVRRDARFPGMHPVSISSSNIHVLRQPSYSVTFKTDGIRAILTVLPNDDSVYITTRTMEVYKLRGVTRQKLFGKRCMRTQSYQLDGEMMCYRVGSHVAFIYIPHDTLTFCGQCVEALTFKNRHACLESLVSTDVVDLNRDLLIQSDFIICKKPFMNLSYLLTFQQQCESAVPSDGFIFQNWNSEYVRGTCDSILKWKPYDFNSVDFRLHIQPLPNQLCRLSYSCSDGSVVYQGLAKFSDDKKRQKIMSLHNNVVECVLMGDGSWKVKRVRRDKNDANSRSTYQKVLESIEDRIELQQLCFFIASVVQNHCV